MNMALAKYITGKMYCETVKEKYWYMDDKWESYDNKYYVYSHMFRDIGYSEIELRIIFACMLCDHVNNRGQCLSEYINMPDEKFDEGSNEEYKYHISYIVNDIKKNNENFYECMHGRFALFSNYKTVYIITTCYDRRKWPIVAIAFPSYS